MARISASPDNEWVLELFGASVYARRMRMNISQEVLAAFVGIDRSHMGKIERDECNVKLLNIVRIANAMQCNPSDLLIDAGL